MPMPAITTKIAAIAANSAQPCRMSPTRRPNVNARPAGIAKIATICRKFVSGVGFSYGCAEFALKKPPPFVPIILIDSCDATGPIGSVCVSVVAGSVIALPFASFSGWPSGPSFGLSYDVASTVVASRYASTFWIEPCCSWTTASTIDSGSSRYSVTRVRSTQKLPIDADDFDAKPRINANATAMPVAADRKFCTVSASICTR